MTKLTDPQNTIDTGLANLIYSVLADQKQLFSAKYLPYLPSEGEWQRELQRERLSLDN